MYQVERIDKGVDFNAHGWSIVREDGAKLQPFVTRREAEILVEFFSPVDLNRRLDHDTQRPASSRSYDHY
jgi:hypothetical protein